MNHKGRFGSQFLAKRLISEQRTLTQRFYLIVERLGLHYDIKNASTNKSGRFIYKAGINSPARTRKEILDVPEAA